jgi:hypothetical protein
MAPDKAKNAEQEESFLLTGASMLEKTGYDIFTCCSFHKEFTLVIYSCSKICCRSFSERTYLFLKAQKQPV